MICNFFKGILLISILTLVVWCTGCSDNDNFTNSIPLGNNREFMESVFPTEKSWTDAFPIAANNPNCTGAITLSRANFFTQLQTFPISAAASPPRQTSRNWRLSLPMCPLRPTARHRAERMAACVSTAKWVVSIPVAPPA